MKTASSAVRTLDGYADGFEFPIRKEIRNKAVACEVDRGRRRDMWQWVAAGIVFALVLAVSAGQRFEMRVHGYKVEQLQREMAAEEETNRQLRLKIESLRDLSRIEREATARLGLTPPGQDDIVILRHLEPSALPEKSVVAAR
ncbi:MAG: hypothetical protein ACE148_05790 [Vicinamibacterales bacterium]